MYIPRIGCCQKIHHKSSLVKMGLTENRAPPNPMIYHDILSKTLKLVSCWYFPSLNQHDNPKSACICLRAAGTNQNISRKTKKQRPSFFAKLRRTGWTICSGAGGSEAQCLPWLHHLLRRPLSGTLGGHREVGQARRRLATARSERREKTGKDGKRWENMGKDGKFYYFLIGKTIVVGRDVF